MQDPRRRGRAVLDPLSQLRGSVVLRLGDRLRSRRCVRWCLASFVLAFSLFLWRGAHLIWQPPRGGRGRGKEGAPPRPAGPVVTLGTMGTGHDVSKFGAGSSGVNDTADAWTAHLGSLVTPDWWDSRLCLEHWGRPELQAKADPNGYVVFVSGAEQLGGNKYLLADGLFIAKMLDRTLVEYPAKNARISDANATMGIGAYWDLTAMCMNHRILDLRSFRTLVERGLVRAEEFVTIQTGQQGITTQHFKHAEDVQKYYKERVNYKVIVMEHTWKSSLNRHTMAYLNPNPFYLGVARMLMVDHEDFANGNFLAVQWRTETATGVMADCYEEVRTVVEEHRLRLGFTRDQVLFSTDLYGSTSGTYRAEKKALIGGEALRRIREDYPKALDNRLHAFFNKIEFSRDGERAHRAVQARNGRM